MINKRISKVTMLTCLMLGGIVNAQEFYTCVPKKSWWMDTMTDSVKTAIKESKPISKWRLVWERYIERIGYDESVNVKLSSGKYKIVLSNRNKEPEKEFEVLGDDVMRFYVTWNGSVFRIHISVGGVMHWNANKPEYFYLYKYE